MSGVARFAELVARPQHAIPLDEAALVIAGHAYPTLDVAEGLHRLDELAGRCPLPTLEGLRRYLFDEVGFAGNTFDFADPRNSLLNEVLDRRLGIPISLAVVFMEVGRRLGVPLEGVGMPGHFIVRHLGEPHVYVDAFAGTTLDDSGVEALYHRVHGESASFGSQVLPPAPPRAILARMLANLRQLYTLMGDPRSTGWVLLLRAAIPAANTAERADVASAQAALGRYDDAAASLEAIAEELVGEHAERAHAEAQLLRSRLN